MGFFDRLKEGLSKTRKNLVEKVETVFRGRKIDADYLIKIADNIPGGRTICAFGEACSWPVQSFVGKFKDEFVAKGTQDEERRSLETKCAEPVTVSP